jgi:hypothetical protein
MRAHRMLSRLAWASPLLAAGCSSAIDIDVVLVDPCNQEAVGTMDFLRFVPRGEGLDSEAFTTVYGLDDTGFEPIRLPLVRDFTMLATGHRSAFDAPAAAIGVSAARDLTNADAAVTIRIPFALIDSFYRTTDLAGEKAECTGLKVDRFGASSTYLPANGRVLVVGGSRIVPVGQGQFDVEYPRAVELYDPATGTFEVVAELRIGQARANHTATLLADGRVLLAGGEGIVMGRVAALKSAFLIDARDPADVRVSEGIVMGEARTGHAAVGLDDGRVVIVGGRELTPNATGAQDHRYLTSVELFDPEEGIFVRASDRNGNAVQLASGRFGHTATLLDGGSDVLVAGGMDRSGPVLGLEVIRVAGELSSVVQSPERIGVGAIFHAAARTPDGKVLLSGGYGSLADAEPSGGLPRNPSAQVESWSFNRDSGALTRGCTANLAFARGQHSLTVVGRRAVMIGGRGEDGLPLQEAEVATLASGNSCFTARPEARPMGQARAGAAVTLLEGSKEIIVIGGRQLTAGDAFGTSSGVAEIFAPARDL